MTHRSSPDDHASGHGPRDATATRHVGPPAPADLLTPVRRTAIECVMRADGSMLVRWPADACRLEPGTADANAPTTRIVGNVTDWLDVWAEAKPETMLLAERTPEGEWASIGYRDARRQILKIGAQLLRLCAGDTDPAPIAILTANSLRQALLTFAALYVGIPVAPVSPSYLGSGGDHARLRHVLQKLRPSHLYAETVAPAAAALEGIGIPLASLLTGTDIDDWLERRDDEDLAAVHAAHRAARGERLAKVMFTSGSTGSPKGVAMTHAMLASAQATTAAVLDRLPPVAQVYLEWLPWHHVMGGNINLHRALRFGASIHLDGGRPMPGKIDETIANLRDVSPTFYFNVPLGYALLVPALERDADLASRFFARLEYMTFGGASLSPDLVDRLGRLAARVAGRIVPVVSGFGATETSGPALGTTWSMDSGGAVGLPAPGITAKLVPLQDRFELRVAGDNILRAYLDDPEATRVAFDEEGFYRLGDAVQWIDPHDPLEGLRFSGRVSEDFKLSSGTWVNAGAFRAKVVASFAPVIREAVVTGQDRLHIGAMGFIDERACRQVCGAGDAADAQALVQHPAVLQWLAARLAVFNAGATGSSQRLERMLLLWEPPVAEAFEITDKGYVNQRAVMNRRAALVDSLYSPDVPVGVVAAAVG